MIIPLFAATLVFWLGIGAVIVFGIWPLHLLWWFVLNVIILTTRPKRSGHAYDQIWNRELNESPLKTITRAQSDKVAALFEDGWLSLWEGGLRWTFRPTAVRLSLLRIGQSAPTGSSGPRANPGSSCRALPCGLS